MIYHFMSAQLVTDTGFCLSLTSLISSLLRPSSTVSNIFQVTPECKLYKYGKDFVFFTPSKKQYHTHSRLLINLFKEFVRWARLYKVLLTSQPFQVNIP